MANETTTGSAAAMIATEILARQARKAHLPKMVLSSLVHQDDISAERSNTKRYIIESDLGVSSAGAEGVALTPTVEVGFDSSVTVTVSEGVADMALLTELAVSTALGIDMSEVQRIMVEGTQEEFLRLLAPLVNRLMPRGMQKIESDLLAQLSNITASVGSTTVDLSLTTMLQAQYQYRVNQALRPISFAKYLLTENQANEVNIAALAASGGAAGAIWGQPGRFGMAQRGDDGAAPGHIGSFLGYDVHTYDAELNVTANGGADVLGAFGDFGDPALAPDAPALAGRPGALVLANRGALRMRFKEKLEHRGAGVIMNAYYGGAMVQNKGLVALLSDAP